MKVQHLFYEKKVSIGASILSADLSKLHEESTNLIAAGVDFLHLDIMDGHLVPNISIGPPVIASLRKNVKSAFFDAHLMVSNPHQWIEPLSQCNTDLFVFHVEAYDTEKDITHCINEIRKFGMDVGIAFSPKTEIEQYDCFLATVDVALIMTVEPGFGGQKFMDNVLYKAKYIKKKHPTVLIEMDGGINCDNIRLCFQAGVDMFVCGSSITKSQNYKKAILNLRHQLSDSLPQF